MDYGISLAGRWTIERERAAFDCLVRKSLGDKSAEDWTAMTLAKSLGSAILSVDQKSSGQSLEQTNLRMLRGQEIGANTE